MYDIRSEADFKEHRLPKFPPRDITSYADRTPGVDFGQSQILRRRFGWAPYRVRLQSVESCQLVCTHAQAGWSISSSDWASHASVLCSFAVCCMLLLNPLLA